ncbi:amidohydrolase family protein [Halorubrum sp. Boch-26]|jgi:predicted TIM-barrel fold metal-dependent hydrolase|uniref:amidohydrolase family protein n=1 Tax=Halorubrum sp. Boch-26 TaxID=2994426 RepID=UPI0024683298|nr:amidohydrolase family protein [Halorubrum sp. Boch-26]
MLQHQGEDIFVVDGHLHAWDATEENIIHEGGEQFIQCFYDYHTGFTPEERQWTLDEFRTYSDEKLLSDVFGTGDVDVGIFQPTYLKEFYEDGFNTIDDCGALADQYSDRLITNGRFDPREGEAGLEELERQAREYDIQGVKVYTAEWRGDSKGWRLDSDDAFEFLQKCVDLGVKNIHPHKGPTIRPLNRDAFDVADVDDAATSFPELNFVVEHVGLPRLDDFCWIGTQEPNVYGGLAVAAPMALDRPKKFREILGELLYWLGEDKVLFGSDYAIWEPDWVLDAVVNTEFTEEEKAEYGLEFDMETKKKVLGENAAELYDIDIEERKAALRDDEISDEFDTGAQYEGAAD